LESVFFTGIFEEDKTVTMMTLYDIISRYEICKKGYHLVTKIRDSYKKMYERYLMLFYDWANGG